MDIRVLDDGTVVGFQPLTESARDWVAKHVAAEPWQWMGEILWVDHRLANMLATGMAEAGLALEVDTPPVRTGKNIIIFTRRQQTV
jgi:hypothetical protein